MGINNRNYGTENTQTVNVENRSVDTKARAVNMAKVYGYMFIGLLITAAVAFLCGYLFTLWIKSSGASATNSISIIMIVVAVLALVMTFVVQFTALKDGKGLAICAGIYTVLMGILLSTFTIYIDWRILGMAFGLTSGIFGMYALIGLIAKGNLNFVGMMGIGLLFGAGIMALFSWIFILCNPMSASSQTIVWIIDIAMFVAINLIALFDIVRMNKIAEQGAMSTNLALYCAFSIYVDFIYVFIKIVYFIARNSRN